MSEPRTRRPLLLVALDILSVLIFGLTLAWLVSRLAGVPSPEAWPFMLGAALAGIALADFGTGLIHWAGDTFGSEGTPLLGPAVIAPFREHHRDPFDIVRHGFLEVTGNNALLMSPLLFVMAGFAPQLGASPFAAAAIAGGLAFVATAVISNQLHRWAHMARVPRLVAWLQRHHVILSRVEHSRHHRGAHDRGYCVANGWMNPLLDRLAASGERPRAHRA